MRLVIDLDGVRHDIALTHHAATVTIAELVESATGTKVAADEGLWIDDRRCRGADQLDHVPLLEGSQISRTRLVRPTPLRGWSVTVSGGLDAGSTYSLPEQGAVLVGRTADADILLTSPSVSRRHARLEVVEDGVKVSDLGAKNRTLVDGKEAQVKEQPAGAGGADRPQARIGDWETPAADQPQSPKRRLIRRAGKENTGNEETIAVDGSVLLVGGTALTIHHDLNESPGPQPGSHHNLTAAGTVPFNRPPETGRPSLEVEPLDPPERKPSPPPARFNVAATLLPLLAAVVAVFVMKQGAYGLIALMSPLIGVGTYLEQKRRVRLDTKSEDERFAKAVTAFTDEMEETAAQQRRHRAGRIPHPVIALRLPSLPSSRLWQRRQPHNNYLLLHAGVGDIPWKPVLSNRGARQAKEVKTAVNEARIRSASVEVDLAEGGVVGIVGERDGALAVARSLLCQATAHTGPADLTVALFCDAGRDTDWSWTMWLPHTHIPSDPDGRQWLACGRLQADPLLRSLLAGVKKNQGPPTTVVVLDSDLLTEGQDSPARELLGHGRNATPSAAQQRHHTVSGIVIAAKREQLPAAVTTFIDVGRDAKGTVTYTDDATLEDVVLAGVSTGTAMRFAQDLARFADPELALPGAALPPMVRLSPLLDLQEVSAEAIRRRWSAATRFDTPVGVGESGSFTLDLVRDGPHGLVGGTTGSGKSEFLRTLVAGLAARNDPTRLTFILIDFKGGAAFATCERLPHTIGTVSNLDPQLANRAIKALEAEMLYRQRMFEQADGVDNLDAYLATNPSEPMPRLLLVIDEFAMLAKDYPDVLASLVKVAAVGRTLGVHMILATQRPAGVVNDDILANTNLRVALRVQSREDSSSVIDVPDASAISRTQMGRAYVKLGEGDITPVQTALVTGAAQTADTAPIALTSVAFGEWPAKPTPQKTDNNARTDLDELIDAIAQANDQLGYAPPRPVWPQPLPERVQLAATSGGENGSALIGGVVGSMVNIGLSDDPENQRQIPAGWDLTKGNLLLVGIPGSGTTTALASIALSLAADMSPEDLDVMVLDFGARDLEPLTKLPHTTAYVGPGPTSRERQVRLLKYLKQEVEHRRAHPQERRRLLVLVDGLSTLKEDYSDDSESLALMQGFYSAYADGPDLRISFAVTTTRAKGLPGPIDDVTTQRWLFQLADPYDYTMAGLDRKSAPTNTAGRCVPTTTQLQTQVATPAGSLYESVERVASHWPGHTPKPTVIGRLPDTITLDELGVTATVTGEPWRIPVGIAESDLQPAWLEVYEGEHILIAGPARCGKSTVLIALGEAVRRGAAAANVPIVIWGIGNRRSPLVAYKGLDRCSTTDDERSALLASALVHRGPLVLLIDEAEKVDDNDQSIQNLLRSRPTGLLVLAAGRADDLRSMYSHWTKEIRKSKTGILLRPTSDYDGELLGASLPRRTPVEMLKGRGYICQGAHAQLVQAIQSRLCHIEDVASA